MSTGLGIGFAFEPGRVGGPRLLVFVEKPVLDNRMNCWTCRIRLDSGDVRERNVYGASSLQALTLAADIIPSLIQTFFPGETFTEDGVAVVLPTEP
jgi:hypothetical protein